MARRTASPPPAASPATQAQATTPALATAARGWKPAAGTRSAPSPPAPGAPADSPTGGPPAGPPAPDSRREQMLLAAVEVLVRRGFADTRISDVAAAAGVSTGLVIYYFKTKEALLTAALRHSEDLFYADASRRLAAIGNARDRLEELVRMSCQPDDPGQHPGSWALWFDLWSQAVRRPEARRDRQELDGRWRAAIADIARDGQAAGEFDAVDADDFALLLAGLLDGLSVQLALDDAEVGPARAFRLSMRLCARELGFPWPEARPA